MKKSITMISCLLFTVMLQAQLSKELNLNAGDLSSALDSTEKVTITSLTLTGTIDSRDFRTMRDSMPVLSVIDLHGTTVAAYSGKQGASGNDSIVYSGNVLPDYAFKNPNAYHGKAGLTSVILPSAIDTVGENAFAYCDDISSVVMPSSVTYIGYAAFQYCSRLDLNSLPSSLVSIGVAAFLNCTSLSSLSIPPSVTTIEVIGFYGCNGLSSINIPASVTFIGETAFSGCTGNVTVDPANNDYAGIEGVLYNKDNTLLMHCPASKTGNFSIPASVTNIGNSAFFNCNVLTDIQIPSSVSTIQNSAFQGCTEWEAINIPSSVSTIEAYAFYDCTGYITVNDDNPGFSSLEGQLFDKAISRLIYCPPTKSGHYIFPSTVTTIEIFAFNKCSLLSSITIPSTVTSIKIGAFYFCSNLRSIIVEGTVPVDLSSSSSVFFNVPMESCTLFVPAGSLQDYQMAAQWKEFAHIIEGNGFWLSAVTLNFEGAADTSETIIVNSNAEWLATSGADWLTISPKTNNTGTDTLIVIVTKNPDVSIRTSTITISADGVSPEIISVTQEGSPTEIPGLNKKELILYPNPADNIIYINSTNNVLISIYNSAGQLVLKKDVYDNQLDINDLNKGEYTIRIEDKGQFVTQKFIKL